MAAPVNDLLARILALQSGTADVVPKGHRTTAQWAKEWGKSVSHTHTLIRAAVDAGLMASADYRIKVGSRRGLFPVPHYFEV